MGYYCLRWCCISIVTTWNIMTYQLQHTAKKTSVILTLKKAPNRWSVVTCRKIPPPRTTHLPPPMWYRQTVISPPGKCDRLSVVWRSVAVQFKIKTRGFGDWAVKLTRVPGRSGQSEHRFRVRRVGSVRLPFEWRGRGHQHPGQESVLCQLRKTGRVRSGRTEKETVSRVFFSCLFTWTRSVGFNYFGGSVNDWNNKWLVDLLVWKTLDTTVSLVCHSGQ